MKISIKGYGENTATFRTSGIVSASHVVKMADNLTVSECSAGDKFIGTAVSVKNEYAGIQLDGYVTVNYSGTAPTVGYCTLVADGNGGVKTASAGKEYLVTDVDTTAKTAGIIL